MEKEKSEDEAISCISNLMRYTDENHVITGEDICSAMADIYGIEAERRVGIRPSTRALETKIRDAARGLQRTR